jgi:uncharacterized membrane protein YuzA (DUF378 family)
MLKRISDYLEKLSVGSMVVGMFQYNMTAIVVGLSAIIVSLFFTKLLQKRESKC